MITVGVVVPQRVQPRVLLLQLLLLLRGGDGVVDRRVHQLVHDVHRLLSVQQAEVLVGAEVVVLQLHDRRLAVLNALRQVVDVRLHTLNVLIVAVVLVLL